VRWKLVNPEGGLRFKSDQGVQSRSRAYRHHLARGQIGQRMSRKPICLDNDPIARLFRSLKTKWISSGGYGIFQKGSQDMGAFFTGYYNQERLHINNYFIQRCRSSSKNYLIR
jgi:putative transposase